MWKNSALSTKNGFTLVELSIVLVIIGLLVGGVLVSKDLIEKAELRSVVTDLEAYQTAVRTFQLKYNGLPGDITDAEAYWGSDTSCPNTPTTTVAHVATCNGDGDGYIGYIANLGGGSKPTNYKELFRAWQQLSNAGLINGMFTGVTGASSSSNLILQQNIPTSRIANAGYIIVTIAPTHSNAAQWLYYSGNYGVIIEFGGIPDNNETAVKSAISTEGAYYIDTKMDDGLPATGRIVTWRHGNGWLSGVTSNLCANVGDTAYDFTQKGIQCSLVLRNVF